MRTPELARQLAALRSVIRRTGHDHSTKALEMQAHWAKYACVLTAGFIENMVRHIYGAYTSKSTTNRKLVNYISKQLEGEQNPKHDKLIKIAKAFDDTWGKDLEAHLEKDFRRDAINSIISNRHLIAHGRNSHITVAQVDQHLKRIVSVAEFMEDQCGI